MTGCAWGWGWGQEINALEGIRGNNKSTELYWTCCLISMVITPEHMQHSHTHTAAMTEVLNVHKVILERMAGRKKTLFYITS